MEPTTETPQTHFVNRVTPLSKILALVLFVALPILTLYLGYKKGTETPSSSESVFTGERVNKGMQADSSGTNLVKMQLGVAYGTTRNALDSQKFPIKIIGFGKVLESSDPRIPDSLQGNEDFFGEGNGKIVFEMEEMDSSVLENRLRMNGDIVFLKEGVDPQARLEQLKAARIYVACNARGLGLNDPRPEAGTYLAVPELYINCNPWQAAAEDKEGNLIYRDGGAGN